MPDVLVRQATESDSTPLASVYRSAYRENRELGFPASAESVDPADVAEWIRDQRVFVAVVDESVVGGVRMAATDPDRVKLSRLGVHEGWKGEGIGTELLGHAEAVARSDGYERVWLTTPYEHPHLPGFYRRRGYEVAGPYPLEDRDYDEVVVEKSLR